MEKAARRLEEPSNDHTRAPLVSAAVDDRRDSSMSDNRESPRDRRDDRRDSSFSDNRESPRDRRSSSNSDNRRRDSDNRESSRSDRYNQDKTDVDSRGGRAIEIEEKREDYDDRMDIMERRRVDSSQVLKKSKSRREPSPELGDMPGSSLRYRNEERANNRDVEHLIPKKKAGYSFGHVSTHADDLDFDDLDIHGGDEYYYGNGYGSDSSDSYLHPGDSTARARARKAATCCW